MSLFAGLLDAISGAESGFIALVFVMPLENLNKLQAGAPEGTTLLQVAQGIYNRGGLRNFWNAWGPVASVVVTEKFGMFFFYSFLLSIYQRVLGGAAGFWPNLVIGYAADLFRLPFTYPIELTAVAVQGSPAGTSMSSIVRSTVSAKGIAGLYAGASSYFGFALRPAIQQTIYDQLKARVLPGGGELAFWTAFGFGAIGRFFAMVFAYPCESLFCTDGTNSLQTPYSSTQKTWLRVCACQFYVPKSSLKLHRRSRTSRTSST